MARMSVSAAARRVTTRLDQSGNFGAISENILSDHSTGEMFIIIRAEEKEVSENVPAVLEDAVAIFAATGQALDSEKLDERADTILADFDRRVTLAR